MQFNDEMTKYFHVSSGYSKLYLRFKIFDGNDLPHYIDKLFTLASETNIVIVICRRDMSVVNGGLRRNLRLKFTGAL